MDNSTCSQESQLSLWQPFFVKRTLFYIANSMKLKITKCFPKNLGSEGKLQVSSCRCLLCQNGPQDKYLGAIFYRTAPIPQWRALDQTLVASCYRNRR